MKHPLITCFLILSLSCFALILPFSKASAQHRFLAGTIVLSSGDTLEGFLGEILGRINPRVVQFKKTFTAEPTSYTPVDLKWFRFKGGEWYFSYMGPLESSTLNTNNLTYDSSMHTFQDTLFIQAVLISRASLYYARDRSDRIHLFIQKLGGEITELAYKKYYVDEIVVADYRNKITKRAIYDNLLYKGQLMRAFRDCPYVSTSITSKQIVYGKNDLGTVFESYNRCKGAKVTYHEPKDNGKVVFTFNGGVNFSNIKFESNSYPPWNNYSFNPSTGYAFGLGCDFLLPRTQGKWGFFNEVSLKSFKADGNLGTEENVLLLDLVYVKLATMMRYYLANNRKVTRPYFALGITNNVAIKTVNINYATNPPGEPILEFFRTYEQGLMFGFGCYYKRLNGEFRYEFSNGISDYTSLKSPAHTAYILVGYKLFEL